MDDLGPMLRAARESKGLTQRAVAQRLTVSTEGEPPEGTVIHKYEKGANTPGLDRMAELIAVLDLDEARAWRAYIDARLKDEVRELLAARPSAWSPRE